jgi:transcriptional regulator with XRE-family HTH domain
MSLCAVAEQADIDKGHLSRVERGQEGLSVAALHRLASVLGLRELERLLTPYTPVKSAKPRQLSGLKGSAQAMSDAEATRPT